MAKPSFLSKLKSKRRAAPLQPPVTRPIAVQRMQAEAQAFTRLNIR